MCQSGSQMPSPSSGSMGMDSYRSTQQRGVLSPNNGQRVNSGAAQSPMTATLSKRQPSDKTSF